MPRDPLSDPASSAIPAQPVGAADGARIASLDFIRGIAVLGILAANIVAFGQPMTAYMYPDAFTVLHGEAADWAWVAQFVLIDGKMRGLFTLLFGAGMMLFMERAWARGQDRRLQARRLAWLGAFGLAHYFLLWKGDILFSYAVTGMVALLCLRMTGRSQLVLGALLYLAGAILWGGLMGMTWLIADTSVGEQAGFAVARAGMIDGMNAELADGVLETRIVTEGSYPAFVAHNVTAHASDLAFFLFLWAFETLPLMLIGMALYRLGLFEGRWSARRVRLWGWAGFVGGGLATLALAVWLKAEGLTYYGTQAGFAGFSYLPRFGMTLGLAALLALWGSHVRGWLAERLSAAGRAAFTNYLGTSLIMLFVFHGWAGGLFGQLGRFELYGVMLAAWALMLAWSKPWLDRYRYGPLEWLWRCLTYGRLFPLRR